MPAVDVVPPSVCDINGLNENSSVTDLDCLTSKLNELQIKTEAFYKADKDVSKVTSFTSENDSDDSDDEDDSDTDNSDTDDSSSEDSDSPPYQSKFASSGPIPKTLHVFQNQNNNIPNDNAPQIDVNVLIEEFWPLVEKIETSDDLAFSPFPSTSGSPQSSSMDSRRSPQPAAPVHHCSNRRSHSNNVNHRIIQKTERKKENNHNRVLLMKGLGDTNFSREMGVRLAERNVRIEDKYCFLNLFTTFKTRDESEFHLNLRYLIHSMILKKLTKKNYVFKDKSDCTLHIMLCQKGWGESLGLLLTMLPPVNLASKGTSYDVSSQGGSATLTTYEGTALHFAVKTLSVRCVKELCIYLKKKCPSTAAVGNAQDSNGFTALWLALTLYNPQEKAIFQEIIQYLLFVTNPFEPINYAENVKKSIPHYATDLLTIMYEKLKCEAILRNWPINISSVESLRESL